MIATGRTLAGRYQLNHQLAVGGTSRVHEATDEVLGRQVAVKLLDSSLAASSDPAGRERFLREGRTAAQFVHPHAVMVLDAGEDEGDLFIVLELVEGPTLAQHLAAQGPLTIDEATRITEQVLDVLGAAHAQGIVHRDVKPANVLLTPTGDVKLADFGIAKRFDDLEDSVTGTGLVIGTPRYLAPEQLTGATVSPATDVYAAGILLFEMLTGRPPFHGATLRETAAQQQLRPPPDVRMLRPEVPEGLATIVAAALATEPGDRPSDAGTMAQAMRDLHALAPPDVTMPATQEVPATEVASRTQVMAPIAAAPPPPSPPRQHLGGNPRPRRAWLAVPVVAVVLLVGVLLLIAASSRGVPEVEGDAAAGAEPEAAAAPAEDTPDPGDSPPDEIMPGFPWTDDLGEFYVLLEQDPEMVGPAGPSVAKDLRKVLEENAPPKQAKKASELQDRIVEQAKDGELDPAIMMVLHSLLEPLAEHPGRG